MTKIQNCTLQFDEKAALVDLCHLAQIFNSIWKPNVWIDNLEKKSVISLLYFCRFSSFHDEWPQLGNNLGFDLPFRKQFKSLPLNLKQGYFEDLCQISVRTCAEFIWNGFFVKWQSAILNLCHLTSFTLPSSF